MNFIGTFSAGAGFFRAHIELDCDNPKEVSALKCPYCGNSCADGARECDVCRQPLPSSAAEAEESAARPRRSAFHKILLVLCWIACFIVLGIGIYKLVFWIDEYKIERLYTRGAYTPTLGEMQLSDGRNAHTVVFYGKDGDIIYLPELNRSLTICGGIARLEIADSEWFGSNVSEYDYADVHFAPILIEEDGTETQLPVVDYTVNVPESPLTVISPAKDGMSVVTSTYPLELQVVPGSSVYVNGEDLSDRVDRSGVLDDTRLSVQPIGDNSYTIIVRTPSHKETRRDITIYRAAFDINIELDENVSTTSSDAQMTVSGTTEPGAMISVDTDYIAESLQVDMTTGRFSFIARFGQFGNNVVRFRATMEGRADAVISFAVNYKPTLGDYAAGAWKMDYDQLRLYFEQWHGKVFRCVGTIVDSFTGEDGYQYLVMNVGSDSEKKLIVLQNYSTISSFNMGTTYDIYADVTGRYMYNAEYYPMLAARYIDVYEPK